MFSWLTMLAHGADYLRRYAPQSLWRRPDANLLRPYCHRPLAAQYGGNELTELDPCP